jgi:transposase-like protein
MAKNKTMPLEEALQVILASDGDNPLRQMLEWMVQQALEHEMSAHLGAEPYERNDKRLGWRNGHRPRVFTTRVGDLELLVPKDRDGTFSTSLFERYQRSEKALVLSMMEMYIQGVSTRKVASITEELCGRSFSSQLVSKLSGELDEKVAEWNSRPLEVDYPYLVVDAEYEKVRRGGRVISQGVLIVMGINTEGMREILAVRIADTESETTWSDLFRDLKRRGLSGVQLITSDNHEGIKAAVKRFFQGASWQRCQCHFMRNALSLAAKGQKDELKADLRSILDSEDTETLLFRLEETVRKWSELRPAVADKIDLEIVDCLAVFCFPRAHRVRLRTTNALERLNEEIRRRTRVVRIFPSEKSALRLIATLAAEQSEDWTRRYLDMSMLAEWSALDDEFSRGVLKMTGGIDEASHAGCLTSLVPQPWPFDEPAPTSGDDTPRA